MDVYSTVYLDERVALSPTEINKFTKADDINAALTTKLKTKYEGRCTTNGFIRPGSVGIMGRSFGRAANGDFTGHWLYDCKMTASVLYPVAGAEFQVQVIKVNKMGAYAHFDEAIRILLPRDTHVGNKEFDEIREGDKIFVRLDRSRFQMNDTYIMAVGTLLKEPTLPKAPVVAVPDEEAEEGPGFEGAIERKEEDAGVAEAEEGPGVEGAIERKEEDAGVAEE